VTNELGTAQDKLERRIKARAYHIWMEEGQPQGKDREHWIQAKAEVLAREPRLMEEDTYQTEKDARRLMEGGEADKKSQREQGANRTSNKPIGQVEYADNEGGGEQKRQGGSTRTTTLEEQGVARDQRGRDQPADKRRAQKSQTEGPAAYAPHQEDEGERAFPDRKPAKTKTGEF
jgi:hypothetical protein